jgi:hypothetical protein
MSKEWSCLHITGEKNWEQRVNNTKGMVYTNASAAKLKKY